MSTTPVTSRAGLDVDRAVDVRRSTETKAAFKTTEFVAYLAMLAGIFIAGAITKGANDVFRGDRVWLYATILSVGYMISRGLAKAGSPDNYTEER